MDASFVLARLAERVSEASQVARFRSVQTADDMEATLVYWGDSQRDRFVRVIAEPLREGFDPLRRCLVGAEERLREMSAEAETIEQLANAVASGCQDIARDCGVIARRLTDVHVQAEEAKDLAARSRSRSMEIGRSLDALGDPPI